LSDLAAAAPAFSIQRASNVDTVFIRGVGGGGRNIGFGGRAGVYLDGVYVGQPGALDQVLGDIERVEILRGPQGTLFGRNTVSGAVNIVTQAPSEALTGGVNLIAGNFDRIAGGARISGPLLDDRIAGKLSVYSERRDGYVRNLFDGSDDIGRIDVDSARAGLRIDATERLTLDLAADYTQDHSLRSNLEANSSTLGAGKVDPFAPAPFVVNENDKRIREESNYGASLTARYELDGHSLTSISAWRKVTTDRHTDNDYGPLSLLFTDFNDRFEQLSQELRIASSEDRPFRYVAGVFWLREDADTFRTATAGSDVVGRFPVAPGAVSSNAADVVTESAAAFAHGDLDIGDALTLSAGMRYTHERRTLEFDLDGSRSGAFNIGTLHDFRDAETEDRVTPSFGARYRLMPDISVYASYAEGFKSGGWNIDFLNTQQLTFVPGRDATPFAFDTEKARSYEVGVKSEWLEHRLRVNAAVFSTDYRGFQTNQFIEFPGGRTVIALTNAAKAQTQGLEIDLEARIAADLRVLLNYAYIDAEFDSFRGGGVAGTDATGNRLPYAPRNAGAASIAYDVPLQLAAGRVSVSARYDYRSDSFSGQENTPEQRLAAYGLYGARIGWQRDDGRWGVALWGENLGNERYLSNRLRDFLGTQVQAQGMLRQYGVELTGAF
jgi:iron complex outermembrane receptor protein